MISLFIEIQHNNVLEKGRNPREAHKNDKTQQRLRKDKVQCPREAHKKGKRTDVMGSKVEQEKE